MKKRLFSVLACLMLAACAGEGQQAACPDAGVVADAGSAPFFARAGKNLAPADVGVYAVMRNLRGGCTAGKDAETVDIGFDVVAQKTPVGQAVGQQNLSYFVAIMDKDETILQRHRFYVTVDFGKNDSGVQTVEHRVKIPGPGAAEDRIVVGFTLSPEQVAFNKAYPHDVVQEHSAKK